jgi:pimeloyl-ACP methyl ester carboxylesterase
MQLSWGSAAQGFAKKGFAVSAGKNNACSQHECQAFKPFTALNRCKRRHFMCWYNDAQGGYSGLVKLEKHKIELDSANVYYQVAGEGLPLVLIHGLSGSTHWWVKNIQALSEHFRLYVLDLIGFGLGRGQPFALSESAQIIHEWLDQLGLERVHLVGHSMGGYIATDLSLQYPEKVNRLVLVDALVTGLGRSIVGQGLGLLQAIRFMKPDFLPVLIRDSLRAGPLTMSSAVRQIQTANLTPLLPRLKVPTLVVWGENDRVMPGQIGRQLAERISGSKYVIIAGAGHNPMWDRPEAFNQAVLKFLKGD